MAYAYGIDNDDSFINRLKYSSIGHNILSSIVDIVGVKGYKQNRSNKLVKILPKCIIDRTSGLDYIEDPNNLPSWLESSIDSKYQTITINTNEIR